MKLKIRLMKYDDLSAVLFIEEEIYSDPWVEEMFYKEIELNQSYVLEDVKTKRIIGYYCGMQAVDEYSLMNIAIAPDYQSSGYGTLLMKFMVSKCRFGGIKFCFLEVRRSNLKAINLYDSFGFAKIGLRKGYYNNPEEDAIVMRLQL